LIPNPWKYRYEVRVHYTDENAVETLASYIKEHLTKDMVLVCIGTDRCIGDALGPITGTMLESKSFSYPFYGTVDDPVHAVNLKEMMAVITTLHPDGFFIAVDACLGAEESIGSIHIKKGPIFPGKGVGKKLPSVGHLSIVGIVDKINHDDCFAIHNIRLSLVMKMSKIIADAIILATQN
jgi:putative sporulation protein YyaC